MDDSKNQICTIIGPFVNSTFFPTYKIVPGIFDFLGLSKTGFLLFNRLHTFLCVYGVAWFWTIFFFLHFSLFGTLFLLTFLFLSYRFLVLFLWSSLFLQSTILFFLQHINIFFFFIYKIHIFSYIPIKLSYNQILLSSKNTLFIRLPVPCLVFATLF